MTKPKKIFIICPIRHLSPTWKYVISRYVSKLEAQGYQVYWPLRDTNQKASSLEICQQNRTAISHADEVHVFYDNQSEGVLFDLGMAFAMHKRVVPVQEYFPAPTDGKSFANLVYEWSKQ